jgi:hypothetical protein
MIRHLPVALLLAPPALCAASAHAAPPTGDTFVRSSLSFSFVPLYIAHTEG